MLTRKCALCGETIELSLPYSRKYIYYATKKKWYHLDCFTAVTTPRVGVNSWIDKTEAVVRTEVPKDKIYLLFTKHYNVSYISSGIFKKLDEIYKGTYKGLAQPISPEELYDILVRKDKYIQSMFIKRGVEDVGKIHYALAVAMGFYKDYKEWIDKVKAEQEEQEASRKRSADFSRAFNVIAKPVITDNQEESIDYEETMV